MTPTKERVTRRRERTPKPLGKPMKRRGKRKKNNFAKKQAPRKRKPTKNTVICSIIAQARITIPL